jgi:hypothetical protein
MSSKYMRKLMICANDHRNHDVCFTRMGNGWMLENERDGLVSIHETLPQALEAMFKATLSTGLTWSVKDNPYGGD